MFPVWVESGRITRDVESVGAMEVGGPEGYGGGILDQDVEMGWWWENPVGGGSVCQGISGSVVLIACLQPKERDLTERPHRP